MKTLLILILLWSGADNTRPIVISVNSWPPNTTMGQLLDYWRQEIKSREDNNFWWYIHRCEKNWDDPNDAPWYIRNRVKEYFN